MAGIRKWFKRRSPRKKKGGSGSFPVEAANDNTESLSRDDHESNPEPVAARVDVYLAENAADEKAASLVIPESLQTLSPQVALNIESASEILAVVPMPTDENTKVQAQVASTSTSSPRQVNPISTSGRQMNQNVALQANPSTAQSTNKGVARNCDPTKTDTDSAMPILMRGNSADTSDTSPPRTPSKQVSAVAARAAMFEKGFSSPAASPSPVTTTGMSAARQAYWEKRGQESETQSPGSLSSASTPSPMKPRTEVLAKTAWLEQAFTPQGVGNMSPVAAPVACETAHSPSALNRNELREVSNDPMSWAYSVWHSHGLLTWSPSNRSTPSPPPLTARSQQSTSAEMETASSTSVQVGERINSNDLEEAVVASRVVARSEPPIVETVVSDSEADDEESNPIHVVEMTGRGAHGSDCRSSAHPTGSFVVKNPFDSCVSPPGRTPGASSRVEEAKEPELRHDVGQRTLEYSSHVGPECMQNHADSEASLPVRKKVNLIQLTPLERARQKRSSAGVIAGHVRMITSTRRQSFRKTREAPILSLFGNRSTTTHDDEVNNRKLDRVESKESEGSSPSRVEAYQSYVSAYKNYSKERTSPGSRNSQ